MNTTQTNQTPCMAGWNAFSELLNKSVKPIYDRIEAEQSRMRPQNELNKKSINNLKNKTV